MSRKLGVILSYIYMFFEVLSTLLLTPIIINTLGVAEYGVYKLIASISSYLLLLDLGIGNSVIRYIAKFKENNDIENSEKYLGVCIIFYSFISLLVLIIGGVLITNLHKIFMNGLTNSEIILGKKLLLITVINAAIILGTSLFSNILIAYSKFYLSKGISIFQIVCRIILTAFALKAGGKSIAILSINLLLTVVTRSIHVIYVLFALKLKPVFSGINFLFIKDIITYSFFILLQMIATQINGHIDQILLGVFVPASSVLIGIYGVGTQIVQYFQSIGHALGGILMPGVVKMVEKGATYKELENEMIRIGRYSFIILGLIFVVFLINGSEFCLLWTGAGYEQSYYIALILMFAYMFIMIGNIGTQILWAKNKHQMQSIIKISIVIINIILTVFLIKWDPLMGATIGTFISLILGDVLTMNIVFKIEIGISLLEYYKGIFKGILPCLFLSGIVGYATSMLKISGLLGFILNVSVMTATYGISMWVFGLKKSEKQLLIRITKGII